MGSQLLNEILQLPDKIGVYMLQDKDNSFIYVGKAKNIRKRVLQHFTSKNRKEQQLMSEVASIDFILTPDEASALILEQKKINELEPKYNVSFKDDKSYPYIKITSYEKYPRILMLRKLKTGEDNEAEFIGPFANVDDLKRTLNYLRTFFPVANCKNKITEESRKRPCLEYGIKRCMGPCFRYVDPEEYNSSVGYLKMFFKGKGASLIKNLSKEMEGASSRQEYEKAALMRDRLFAVNSVIKSRVIGLETEGSLELITLERESDRALVGALSVNGEGIANQRYFNLKVNVLNTEEEIYAAFLVKFYSNQPEVPDKIIIDTADERLTTLFQGLLSSLGKDVIVKTAALDHEKQYMGLLKESAKTEFKRKVVKEFTDASRLLAIIKDLRTIFPKYIFKENNLRVAAYDVSNLRGQQATGSMVVFIDGYPFKRDYRTYRIKTISKQDDYAMLTEVLGRSLKNMRKNPEKLPDLIVIDGGRGQLNAGLEVLNKSGLDIPIVALAKHYEEIYTALSNKPLNIPDDSGLKTMLKYIRDEAHRFSVNYHRKLRSKELFRSCLDGLPGVGEKLKEKIRSVYPDISVLRDESIDRIVKKLGVSYRLAEKIKSNFPSSK